MVRILLVDHKKREVELLRKVIKSGDRGASVTAVSSFKGVQKALARKKYDLILSNVVLPEFTGHQLLEFLRNESLSVPVLFLSDPKVDETASDLLRQGALGIIPKTKSRLTELPAIILQLLQRTQLEDEDKTLRARLEQSEKRFRTLFQRALEGIVLFDAEGIVLEANPAVEEISGYRPEELVGKNFLELFFPGERLRAEELSAKLKKYGWSRSEFELQRRDGQSVYLEFNTATLEEGVFQCVFRDITDRRKREEEVYKQNKLLLGISDVAFSLMESMRLEEVLHAAVAKIKEITEGQFVGIFLLDEEEKYLDLAAHSETASDVLPLISRLEVNNSLTGESVRSRRSKYISDRLQEDMRVTPQGRKMATEEGWKAIAVIPLKAQDEVLGAIDVLFTRSREISTSERQMFTIIGSLVGAALENARLYEQTVKKSKEIERRNRELRDFTYVVSHDLKEPLVGIEGFSGILLSQYGNHLDEEARDSLKTLVKLSTQMKGLINDLLKYASVGDEGSAVQSIETNDIIEHLKQELDYSIRKKNARIEIVTPLPRVTYPELGFMEVFRNLISNAIKFNDKIPPVVEIGCESGGTEHRFFVRDNGIGIPKEYFDKIFFIFQRLNPNERFEGTGIGLTMAKKIVETNGGRIWVESEVGKGSTFHFTVPVQLEGRS